MSCTGSAILDNLDNEPIVFQVPDFGDRFWVYALYDARTDEFSNIGKQYGTKPGFYMVVGPNWKGETPKGITAVLRSSTTVVAAIATRFHGRHAGGSRRHPTAAQSDRLLPALAVRRENEDHGLEQAPALSPRPKSSGTGETQWVNPETFFDELPAVMKSVPPLPGEEALYEWIGSVLDAAAKDPTIKKTLTETAVAAERETDHTVLAVAL